MKMRRNHNGVKIDRVDIGLPILKFRNGVLVSEKPSKEFIWTIGQTNPIKCSDLADARKTIDEFFIECENRGITRQMAVETLNS